MYIFVVCVYIVSSHMDMHLQMGIYEHACVCTHALDQLVECVFVCVIHTYAHTHSLGGRMSGH